jgi:protein TonB
LIAADAGYRSQSPASRAAALSFIIGLHVAVAVAAVSLGGIQMVMKQAQPLLVRLMPAPVSKPPEPTRSVPLPNLRPPDIRLPDPPPIENLYTLRMEVAEPSSAPAPVSVAVVAAPPSPAPALEPPRADMAYLNNPKPVFPAISRRSGEHGIVTLRVKVDVTGSVEALEVHKSSGYSRLDEAALAAVRRWRFMPARLGERAVAGWALVPINFTLG